VRTLALLLLLAAAVPAQERTYEAEIIAGREAFEARKFADALPCFRRAAALRPDDWRGLAYESITLIQLAQEMTDAHQRENILREAERVAGELVRNGIVEFHDPLYRFLRGLIYSLAGDQVKAYGVLTDALRAPREKFAPYDEIDLHGQVQRALSVSADLIAERLIAAGQFERAETELGIASSGLPKGDPERQRFERLSAAVAENLDKIDKAVAHLRTCIELSKSDPLVVDELTATIALIYINHEEPDKGRAVLAEAPKDSRQPDLVAARCTLVAREALREHDRLDEAMAYVKEAMRSYPKEYAYRLVLLYRDLLLARIGQREAQTPEGRALLEEAIPIFQREIELRPECPPLYFAVYRCYKLLGNADEERRYQDLHEQKKKEFEHLDKYDQRGWPRCGN